MLTAPRAAAWVAWAAWTCKPALAGVVEGLGPKRLLRSKESGLRSALFLTLENYPLKYNISG
jgi:hypothetical protein